MNPLNQDLQQILLSSIEQVCAADPSFTSKAIEAATNGVKKFADRQSDSSAKLSFILSQVLDQTACDFPPFTRSEIMQRIAPTMEGTPWWDKQPENVKPPEQLYAVVKGLFGGALIVPNDKVPPGVEIIHSGLTHDEVMDFANANV